MKNTLLLTVFILALFSCKETETSNEEMVLIKDCTGAYLRSNGKDYQVCNLEKISAFPNEAKVRAAFEKIEDCPDLAQEIVCKMLHANEGWIEVKEIESI